MKIGYFVETPVEKNLTGGSRSFLDLLGQLVYMGVAPYVVVSEPWSLTEILTEMGVPFITTRMYRPFIGTKKKAKLYRIKYIIKLVINRVALRRACAFFRQNGVEMIHINSQFCGLVGAQAAQKLKIPYIYHIREFLSSHFGVAFYNQKKADQLIGGANAIVAISNAVEQFEKEKYPQARIERIYNGLNYDKMGFEATQRFIGDTIKLSIVGRITESKNQFEAVRAIEYLVHQYKRHVKLYIVGYIGMDNYEKAIEEYVQQYGLEEAVEFVPFTNTPLEVLKHCDIGLMCSFQEAFGRVTIEYMVASLLTIGSNTGGTPELINDGVDGLLYEFGKPEQLAEKINWAIDHKNEANAMMRHGWEKAKTRFSIKNTSTNIFELYQSVMNKR